MLEERYQAILAAYGADPSKWPEAERAAAMAFAATNPDAAGASREEVALDALLGAYAAAHEQSADDAALARILSAMNAAQPAAGSNVVSMASARAATAPVRKASAGWFGERRMMAAGFAFAALAGLAIGSFSNGSPAQAADASDELVVSYALADG